MTNFICNLPWMHLSTFPHGSCTICCVADHSGQQNGHSWNLNPDGSKQILTVKNSTIPEIINCDNFRSIRLDMINGKVPPACNGCHKVEQSGGTSRRIRESRILLDVNNITDVNGYITPDLRHVELRLGNYCNLKCRTCNADSSTSWISDYHKLKDIINLASGYDAITNNPMYGFDWVDSEEWYNELLENCPNLEQLHISGGEPFLVPKHFYCLQKMVDNNKTNISVHYHTNLNYDFDKIRPALDLLSKFKQVNISFSIDDVDERNTYIRNSSNWDLTIKNLKLFLENYNFVYKITQTINIYNFMYADELTSFINNNAIGIEISFNHVHSPDYLMANVLPKHIRQEKINSLEGNISKKNFDDLYGRYYNTDDNGLMEYFKYFTSELDKLRNEDFKLHFSKLIEL